MIATLPRPAIIAHRGASAQLPEHTFAAYDAALAQGADALELDVRPLADGTPVVCHDATLARTCGDGRRVRELTPMCVARMAPETRPQRLAAVLERYAGRTRFLIELKQPQPADLVAVRDVVRAAGVGDATAVQSFDHRSLRALHELDSRLALGALFAATVPRGLLLATLPRVARWAQAAVAPTELIDDTLLARARERGLPVYVFTVNETAAATSLLDAGASGLITDVPELLAGMRRGGKPVLAA